MATKKINYKDKAPLQTKPEIPEENKVNAEDLNQIKEVVNNNADEIELRQLKEEGKGLSKNDFTDELKAKLESLNNYNDTEIKKEISEINKKVTENTQNDIKQDNEILELKTNYANLQEQNTKLESQIKKDRENMINLEVEGQSIHIEDSSDLEGQLEVLGNVEQDTREGYNLYDYIPRVMATTKGLNVTKDTENGYLIVNGTPETNYISIVTGIGITDILKDKVTYTLWQEKYDNKLYLQVVGRKRDGTGYEYFSATNQKKTFTVDKSKYDGYTINIQTGLTTESGTFNNYKNRYMLYEGTEEKPYEPYGASPSPEYPSEIRAVGDKGSVGIRKVSKNYFDKNSIFTSGGYKLSEENGEIIQEKNSEWKCLESYVEIKENSDYTLSGEILKSNWTISIWFYDKNKVGINAFKKSNSGLNIYNFTTPKNAKYIRFVANSSVLNVSTIQLEEGETKTNHEEHQEQTKILPIQKPMLEGDYFIKEADGWKEVHTWENKVINGTETMVDGNSPVADNTLVVSIPRKDSGLTSDKINIISEQFKGNTTANLWVTDKEGISLSAGYISVRINRKRANTLEEVKEYLKQNNIKCFLKKSTENKLLCTPEQTKVLDELNNFQTYKPVTNITTDSIAKLKLKYIADTKTYVDNKTSNLEQQVNVISQLLSTTKTSSVLLDNLQSDIESEVL